MLYAKLTYLESIYKGRNIYHVFFFKLISEILKNLNLIKA